MNVGAVCVLRGQTHWYSYSFALRPDKFHSVPLDAAAGKLRWSISQRRGASLRRLLVKCGLSAGSYWATGIYVAPEMPDGWQLRYAKLVCESGLDRGTGMQSP